MAVAISFAFSQKQTEFIARDFRVPTPNHILTYRDMRLGGWRWVMGWVSFMLTCSFGALANVGIATYLFKRDTIWAISALAGIVVGTVWNYAMTNTYTWGRHRTSSGG